MIEISINKLHQKFNHDSVDFEDDRFEILTSGIFLGIHTRQENSLVNHIVSEYSKKGESFALDLRGSFAIYLFDKVHKKHLVYTNHIGDKRIFYTHTNKFLIVSNSIHHIREILRDKKIRCYPDRNAAYYMLTFGYMLDDATLINEVKRLKPGHYLRYQSGNLEIVQYFKLSNIPDKGLTERDSIEQLDSLFRKSIQLEFEKDLEYGFKHICSLSGGLDSRMTTWVAHELGYTDITDFTFSQSGYLDMTIPRQITRDLNHIWIFKSLDSGLFMCDIEPVNRITDGMASYLPISHGRSAVEELSFDEFGLMHTGQLGDVIIGSYLTSNDYGTPRFTKASSSRFIQKLPQNSLQQHDNLELFLFQNRGFNYILTGNLPIQRYTEVCSPFLDLDFLNFCMSVPLKFRINHRLYKKWILQKYPGAAKYVWERLGTYITTPTISIRKKSVAYTKLPAFVLKGILHNLGIIDSKKLEGTRNMNPFQYWYETKKEISSEMESFFAENIELVSDPEIRKDCGYLYKKGNIQEKSQVLTLLASIKHFFT